MSRQDAPLYVRTFELTVDLHRRTASWSDGDRRELGAMILQEAHALLGGVSLALAFPKRRAVHQARADEALLRLRLLVRLAERLELLSLGAAEACHRALTEAGKMLGGWRKRQARRRVAGSGSTPSLVEGGGSSLAPGA